MNSKKLLIALAIYSIAMITNVFASDVFTSEELGNSHSIKTIEVKPVPVSQSEPVVTPQLKGEKGRVYIAFIVNTDGEVENARAIKSNAPKLTDVVLAAVKKWKFEPGKQDGSAVNVRVIMPIRVDFS